MAYAPRFDGAAVDAAMLWALDRASALEAAGRFAESTWLRLAAKKLEEAQLPAGAPAARHERWSAKGRCPSCRVSTGSRHSRGCPSGKR